MSTSPSTALASLLQVNRVCSWRDRLALFPTSRKLHGGRRDVTIVIDNEREVPGVSFFDACLIRLARPASDSSSGWPALIMFAVSAEAFRLD